LEVWVHEGGRMPAGQPACRGGKREIHEVGRGDLGFFEGQMHMHA